MIGRERRSIVNRGYNPPLPVPPQRTKGNENITEKENETNFSKMTNYYRLHSEFENDPTKHDKKIGFLIVATGKYDRFIEPLINSIEKHFLKNNTKHYNIFSEKDIKLSSVDYSIHNIEHRPFPYPTLKRFHFFSHLNQNIIGDQLIYIDADTLITADIGTEVLLPVVVTQHCGFVNRMGSFERRPISSCYVNPQETKNYYGGGFYSFSREEFFKMSEHCKALIDTDEKNGVMPVWHDESALNKYMTKITPDRVLSPSYHFPENHQKIYDSWGGREKFQCKVLLLNKDHKELRS